MKASDRSFKVIFNEYFILDNQLLFSIISTDYGYSRILVTDEGFTFVQIKDLQLNL